VAAAHARRLQLSEIINAKFVIPWRCFPASEIGDFGLLASGQFRLFSWPNQWSYYTVWELPIWNFALSARPNPFSPLFASL
jgi:hypothetical protein